MQIECFTSAYLNIGTNSFVVLIKCRMELNGFQKGAEMYYQRLISSKNVKTVTCPNPFFMKCFLCAHKKRNYKVAFRYAQNNKSVTVAEHVGRYQRALFVEIPIKHILPIR